MSSSARSEIFARLRALSRGDSAARIELECRSLGSAPAPTPPAPEVCQAFLINVLKNQGSVECVGTRGEAVKAIGQYLYAHFRSHRLVAGNDPRLAAMPWRDAGVLPRFGSLETGEPAALSFAQLGVVETGAVVTWTGRANPAANNLLPEHHIVLVDAADLVPTLEKAWERINQEMEKIGRPRGINFIAGPSSTADIEGQLVYGAHGPRCWHVILLGKVPSDALELARASLARP
jgi:L-lactate dehydrogenase complex protein LldG